MTEEMLMRFALRAIAKGKAGADLAEFVLAECQLISKEHQESLLNASSLMEEFRRMNDER